MIYTSPLQYVREPASSARLPGSLCFGNELVRTEELVTILGTPNDLELMRLRNIPLFRLCSSSVQRNASLDLHQSTAPLTTADPGDHFEVTAVHFEVTAVRVTVTIMSPNLNWLWIILKCEGSTNQRLSLKGFQTVFNYRAATCMLLTARKPKLQNYKETIGSRSSQNGQTRIIDHFHNLAPIRLKICDVIKQSNKHFIVKMLHSQNSCWRF